MRPTARDPAPTWQLLGACLAVVAHRELGHAGSQGGTCGGLGGCWCELAVLLWQVFRRADEGCEEQLKQNLAAAAAAACLGAPGLAPSAGGSLLAAGQAAGGQQRLAEAGSGSRSSVALANRNPTTRHPLELSRTVSDLCELPEPRVGDKHRLPGCRRIAARRPCHRGRQFISDQPQVVYFCVPALRWANGAGVEGGEAPSEEDGK